MSTFVSVNTYTHSVTFVTDKLLTSLKRIITWSGLDPGKFTRDWDALDRGIRTWLNGQYLQAVTLEVYRPGSRALVGRWDFEVEYSVTTEGDGEMWTDTEAIRFAIAKAGLSPAGCDYRIIVDTKPGSPDVEGWVSTQFLSTEGFVRHSVGTAIGTNSITNRAAYWRKS